MACFGATGCTSKPPTSSELRQRDFRGVSEAASASRSESPFSTAGIQNPAARIDHLPVPWSTLQPLLAESTGGTILREVALDQALQTECTFRNIKVSDADVDLERDLLLASIERDAAAGPADSGVLLESVRRSRGLGELRFRQLLERNARLRALVRSNVVTTDDEIEQALLIRYGDRYRIRVIIIAAQHEANDLRNELSKQPALDVAFARAAAIKSTDPSAVRGGLLEPISPADQLYPASIRNLLPLLEATSISPIVAVDKGFAMCILDSHIPAAERPQGAAESAAKEIRVRRERIAMEELARRLLARVKVTPIDAALDWSWRNLQSTR